MGSARQGGVAAGGAEGAAGSGGPRDLVCVAEVAWGYLRTRKQFLLSRLARKWRVIYLEPPAFGRGGKLGARREDGVTVITVPFPKPGTTVAPYNAIVGNAVGRAAIEAVARAWLVFWARRLGLRRPVCVASNVYAARLISALRPRLLCYDFNDHPLQFTGAPPWTERYFRALLDRSDLVLAVSEHYRRELAALTPKPVITLPNGVEFERFAHPTGPVPEDLARLPRPRIGYVGKLSHFLDLPLLERLAASFPHPLVLIGPRPPEMAKPLGRLLSLPNVHYLGERRYEEVPRLLAGLDVGLIPFRAGDRFTRGIHPNKIYQYLAAGLAVVSSPIEDIQEDEAGIFFAGDHESFLAAVERALNGPKDVERLRARARDHDWDALADRMDSILRTHLARAEGA